MIKNVKHTFAGGGYTRSLNSFDIEYIVLNPYNEVIQNG